MSTEGTSCDFVSLCGMNCSFIKKECKFHIIQIINVFLCKGNQIENNELKYNFVYIIHTYFINHLKQ